MSEELDEQFKAIWNALQQARTEWVNTTTSRRRLELEVSTLEKYMAKADRTDPRVPRWERHRDDQFTALQEVTAAEQALSERILAFQDRLGDLRVEKEIVKARRRVAEAQHKIAVGLTGADENAARLVDLLARAREVVDEQYAAASQELAATRSLPSRRSVPFEKAAAELGTLLWAMLAEVDTRVAVVPAALSELEAAFGEQVELIERLDSEQRKLAASRRALEYQMGKLTEQVEAGPALDRRAEVEQSLAELSRQRATLEQNEARSSAALHQHKENAESMVVPLASLQADHELAVADARASRDELRGAADAVLSELGGFLRELDDLAAENARLAGLLREHGIEP